MEWRISLACSHMMMECPRCGFSQPKDRYCASCGLDLEHFVATPKPVLSRIAQNSNLHLTLIGILISLVVAYIFYAQRDLVTREMGHLFKGLPLLSRDSGDPNAPANGAKMSRNAPAEAAADDEIEVDKPAVAMSASLANDTAGMAPTSGSGDKAVEMQKVEISSWEISRETLSTLLTTAEKVGESNGGRAYLWAQGTKAIETVQNAGRRLSLSRTMPVQLGASAAIEAQSTPTDQFQFGLYLQITKMENGDALLKWESMMVLPVGAALSEVVLSGNAGVNSTSALLIIFEPPNRTPREEIIAKAGDGPWSILNSAEFRSGMTEWAVLIQLH